MKKTKKLAVGILAHVDAGKRRWQREFYIKQARSGKPEESITRTPFWTRRSWKKSKGHYHLFQTGRAEAERDGGYTP